MNDRLRRDYLEGSLVVACLRRARAQAARFLKERMDRITSHRQWKETLASWQKAPLRSMGIFLVSAVLTNVLFLFFLRKPPGGAGLCWRGLLLIMGLLALRCPGDWQAVREGSAVLRFLFPRRG